MPRIYKLSRTGLKFLYKVRYHRGHGIHSPFVYNLVTKVIEEKTPYHAYEDIKFALEGTHRHYRLNKINRFLFRMVNYFGAKNILEIGSGYGVNTLCLTASSANISCISVETNSSKYTKAQELYKRWDRDINLHTGKDLPVPEQKQDCIFIDMNNYNFSHVDLNQYLLNLSYEKTFIIVKGIRTNKRHQALWRSIMDIEGRTAALDLFNIGVLFFDTKLYRWSYKISF
ncbi:putative O-methyltransferase YrrM [Dysgonomonas sp. PFB1-18]|uniref:class I SAM-dependent methyltransferase n=1 Tax=unclassified Dysgonomonas TaxID=2630389 RepID=UPI0024737C5A|nr:MULTISPECIES: class I SAM-dependent methyltransferase [unclassified Dysgonomonas]MDL2303269.1 class I SAM-dependent methyltransferase [Dysgonomonas sp. OttesenSCG-928-D17]MDH6310372.1 putative O-methyltransferase YrrM [Dysgonomonas sp. PF1-14]MDH6340298.1 putative O-methyltransferase YrrM [Dysgonomonas sp. PF1-16]MDH6381922.1 putative O-methyltransferase YrrM [Dysgonomonas sp. PFB1-18]MDH6399269.1 putative O-methyltransferase YrrM [Dysgonomonas sp. PF1-23]